GTRLHIYRWLNSARALLDANPEQLRSLPVIETRKKWTKKVHPGISTFGDKSELVGPDHLESLFQHARDIIPANAVKDTPIFLLATAGMRLLPDLQRKELLKKICSYARSHTNFLIPDCDLHIQVIPGETEGLYGWIAANYLLGGFDNPEKHEHGKGHHTYGFLDMGGASAQIAFAPNATEADRHAEDLKLLRMRAVSGEAREYKIFVTTWLGFGVHEARRRYVEALLEAPKAHDLQELPDPCLPVGLSITAKGDILLPDSGTVSGKQPHLIGTGRFDECLRQTYPLLDKDAPCEDEPCLLHGVHIPAIDFDVNHFVGVSEYWHTTHEVFEMAHKDKAYDFNTYQKRVEEFCTKDWNTIREGIDKNLWGNKVSEVVATEVCFKASWLINVLHNGIGIPRIGLESMQGDGHNGTKEVLDKAREKGFTDAFQAVDQIGETEVSWTLGKMILYAASQVPPLDKSLPVGFGSNIPGIPHDFQYAGSKHSPTWNTSREDLNADDANESWPDTLVEGKSPHRIPGFLLFMLIICIAIFLLCGRDRRSRICHQFSSRLSKGGKPSRRRGLLFGAKIPFFKPRANSGTYERVLENGAPATSFELGAVEDYSDEPEPEHSSSDSSSSSSFSKTGKTSGWATPRLNSIGGGSSGYFDHESAHSVGEYRDNIVSQGAGLGLGLGFGPPPPLVPPQQQQQQQLHGGNAMDRSGLFIRTESRERLSTLGEGGRRSRKGSPTRFKSPMMSPLAEY
ncbi:Golgi apyrase, partial [Schaereria dolodes]|nr:Golgi apyrase [Schaereria dolodes]